MNSSGRRVAVLGGIRIPFAKQDGPYARASNQDMLTATLDSVVARFGLEGEVLGEVAAGAVLKRKQQLQPVEGTCQTSPAPDRPRDSA